MKIEGQEISEIETIVTRDVNDAQNLEKAGPFGSSIHANNPVGGPRFALRSCQTANMYFSAMQLNDGKGDYPFTDDCDQVENGGEATNNHAPATENVIVSQSNSVETTSREKSDLTYSATWGCKQQFQSGLLHFVTRIRDRRFVVVDPERGVSSLAFCFFDHAAGKTRTFRLPDGRTVTSGPATPWTWEIAEAFRVEHGQIRRIEAVYHRCPYGMGSGWSNWDDSMSTRARTISMSSNH